MASTLTIAAMRNQRKKKIIKYGLLDYQSKFLVYLFPIIRIIHSSWWSLDLYFEGLLFLMKKENYININFVTINGYITQYTNINTINRSYYLPSSWLLTCFNFNCLHFGSDSKFHIISLIVSFLAIPIWWSSYDSNASMLPQCQQTPLSLCYLIFPFSFYLRYRSRCFFDFI